MMRVSRKKGKARFAAWLCVSMVWGSGIAVAGDAASARPQEVVKTPAGDRFAEVNRALDVGRPEEAIDLLEPRLRQEGASVDRLLTLGVAYARADRIGDAVLAWERALLLSPRDRAVRENLVAVRKKAGLEAPPGRGALWEHYASWLSAEHFAWVGTAALFVLGWLALGFAFAPASGWRRLFGGGARPVLATLGLVAALAAGLGAYGHERAFGRSAIVTAEGGTVRYRSPSEHALEAGRLSEGQGVSWRRVEGDFVEVLTARGERGWVARDALEPICESER